MMITSTDFVFLGYLRLTSRKVHFFHLLISGFRQEDRKIKRNLPSHFSIGVPVFRTVGISDLCKAFRLMKREIWFRSWRSSWGCVDGVNTSRSRNSEKKKFFNKLRNWNSPNFFQIFWHRAMLEWGQTWKFWPKRNSNFKYSQAR